MDVSRIIVSKIFTEKLVGNIDGTKHFWERTDEDYDELAKKLDTEWDGWFEGVRMVEETFDSDTFKISTRVIKVTEREYDKKTWEWIGAKETIGSEIKEISFHERH